MSPRLRAGGGHRMDPGICSSTEQSSMRGGRGTSLLLSILISLHPILIDTLRTDNLFIYYLFTVIYIAHFP